MLLFSLLNFRINNMRKRIKICGITSVEDAAFVCAAGVDAVGLVFYEKSPRNVSISQADNIQKSLSPFITTVGLFLDETHEFIESVLAKVNLDLLQFHGSENAEFCESFGRPYIKAIGMKDFTTEDAFWQFAQHYKNALGFLVDSHATGEAGGTGKTFDWNSVPIRKDKKPIILAGGLNANNIADAVLQVDVYGYDLSSGVEKSPGVKDPDKVKQLMKEVQRVQCN